MLSGQVRNCNALRSRQNRARQSAQASNHLVIKEVRDYRAELFRKSKGGISPNVGRWLLFATFQFVRNHIYSSYLNYWMRRYLPIVFLLGLCVPGDVFAQAMLSAATGKPPSADGAVPTYSFALPGGTSVPTLGMGAVLPLMSPELALSTYQRRAVQQAGDLAAYSAVTVIRAELPDTSQQGEFELQRKFEAPHTLQFTPVHFTGDGFVKSNVITRLLQSEVDHVQKDDPALTAISPTNYKFSYKGASNVENRMVHVFQVKPHKKRPGLFKGRIYLDAHTGTLVRVEGNVVKSPSFFVKHIEFLQDFADVQSFTLPIHIHSEAKARIVGRTIVDIFHRDYQPVPAATTQTASQVPAL